MPLTFSFTSRSWFLPSSFCGTKPSAYWWCSSSMTRSNLPTDRRRGQLEVAAAGRRRDLRHALVGLLHRTPPLRHHAASAERLPRSADCCSIGASAFHADGVDHDVVVLGALHHVLHRLGVAAEVERLVDAVTQREDDAAALLEQQLVDRAVDRIPQRRRPIALQVAAQHLEQRLAVRREVVGLDDDVFAEVADAEPPRRSMPLDERFRGADLQPEFGFMLPLRSSSMMPVIGWTSLEKTCQFLPCRCRRLSKLSRVRSGASRPCESVTVA